MLYTDAKDSRKEFVLGHKGSCIRWGRRQRTLAEVTK